MKFTNRAKMTIASGTNPITLGTAVASFQSFSSSGVINGDEVRYVIEDNDNWEIGVGMYVDNTLTRVVTESTNSNDLIVLTSAATISITLAANDLKFDELNDLISEITTARNGQSSLANRINIISNFASPNSGSIRIGALYDFAFQAQATASWTTAVNRVEMAPFYTSEPMRIDQIGITTSGAASALAKCFIYSANSSRWPDELLLETSEISLASSGARLIDTDFLFQPSVYYWIGCRHNSSTAARAVSPSSLTNLGISGNSYFVGFRTTLDFATPMPSTWVFDELDLVANANMTSVRMRAADI